MIGKPYASHHLNACKNTHLHLCRSFHKSANMHVFVRGVDFTSLYDLFLLEFGNSTDGDIYIFFTCSRY
jgi:hypothetical protein